MLADAPTVMVRIAAVMRAHLEEGRYEVHLIDGDVAGFVRWLIQDRCETPDVREARMVMIAEIGITEDLYGQGIGQALLAWVEGEWAREAGTHRVQLDAWVTNVSAVGVFLNAGFSIYTQSVAGIAES